MVNQILRNVDLLINNCKLMFEGWGVRRLSSFQICLIGDMSGDKSGQCRTLIACFAKTFFVI